MGMEQKTHFHVDKSKCIKCGKCINTCSGMVIGFGEDSYPYMKEFERFGWRGCWRCQHWQTVKSESADSSFYRKKGVVTYGLHGYFKEAGNRAEVCFEIR